MIFQNKTIVRVMFPSLLLTLMFCTGKNKLSQSDVRVDSIAFDGLFFANEVIIIRANDSIIFQKSVDTLRAFQSIYEEFVVDKSDAINLSVQTFFDNRKIIDTSFSISPQVYVNSIGGSICYPSFISKDSLKKIKEPHFGFIPIDSCKRYITLIPDSIMYKYPTY
jgi:hypothetical protein